MNHLRSRGSKISALFVLVFWPLFLAAQCPDCCNSVQDCFETGVDCGGPDCMPCNSLVPNGGFECVSICFFNPDQITNVPPWNFVHATGASEAFHACWFVGGVSVDVPSNFVGTQAAHTGDGYAGFMARHDPTSDPRAEYVQVALTAPLVGGTSYDLSFWVSLADTRGFGVDALGAYFSTGPVTAPDNLPLNMHGIFPQVTSPVGTVITDKVNWVQVSATYTAIGGENNICIGNFKHTNTPFFTFVGGNSRSYYYIDDVSLVPNTTFPVTLSDFSATSKGENVDLQWKTESETNSAYFAVERGTDGAQFLEIGRVTAHGNSTARRDYAWTDHHPLAGNNYYRLRQVDADGAFEYSQIVTATHRAPMALQELILHPVRQTLAFSLSREAAALLHIDVLDQRGRNVGRYTMDRPGPVIEGTLQTVGWAAGVYYIRFRMGGHSLTKKVVVLDQAH